jgi:hypothetical protein
MLPSSEISPTRSPISFHGVLELPRAAFLSNSITLTDLTYCSAFHGLFQNVFGRIGFPGEELKTMHIYSILHVVGKLKGSFALSNSAEEQTHQVQERSQVQTSSVLLTDGSHVFHLILYQDVISCVHMSRKTFCQTLP